MTGLKEKLPPPTEHPVSICPLSRPAHWICFYRRRKSGSLQLFGSADCFTVNVCKMSGFNNVSKSCGCCIPLHIPNEPQRWAHTEAESPGNPHKEDRAQYQEPLRTHNSNPLPPEAGPHNAGLYSPRPAGAGGKSSSRIPAQQQHTCIYTTFLVLPLNNTTSPGYVCRERSSSSYTRCGVSVESKSTRS